MRIIRAESEVVLEPNFLNGTWWTCLNNIRLRDM